MKSISYIFILLFSMVALSAIPSQGERKDSKIELRVEEIQIESQETVVDNTEKVFKSSSVSVEPLSPNNLRTKSLVVKATKNLTRCKEIETLLEEISYERQHSTRTSR